MKTRDWDRAERKILVAVDPAALAAKRKFVADAITDYLAECKARNLEESTIRGYRNTLDALEQFCVSRGIKNLDHIDLETMSAFRLSRKNRTGIDPMNAATQTKELGFLRAFLKFCEQRSWIPANPAMMLKAPLGDSMPTLPFEPEEITKILDACDQITNKNQPAAARARLRARALVLLLLYSGLRISDVALMARDRINPKTGKMLVRTLKTGTPVYLRLKATVLEALDALPTESDKYFFWSGRGKHASIIGSLRRSVECLMKLADVKGHPHRFRDTFAVRLLENDIRIRTVQLLLGHTSVRTTEKHYAPFVQSQQRLLDAATDKLDFLDSSRSGPSPEFT